MRIDYVTRTGPVTRVGVLDAATEGDAIDFAKDHLGVDVPPDAYAYEFGTEVVFENADLP